MRTRFLPVRSAVIALAFLFFGGFASNAAAQVCNGAIGDLVWFDANANGFRDTSESLSGINGVVLELRDSSGALVATTTSGSATSTVPGSYGFGPLCAGTYTVTIVSGVPAGYVPSISPPGTNPSRDSSVSPAVVTILAGPNGVAKDPTVDFGFTAACTGSIGDRVWNDANANGVQDAGEAGIAGVQVRLFMGATQVAVVTTDASGNYTFPGLCAGGYSVVVDAPSGFAASPQFGTADVALDSDASGVAVALGVNENNPTIDFGFFAACSGTVGDRVWFDQDRDGVQDADETGLARVTVELLNGSGNVIATAVTDATGNYLFTGLCASSYSVRVNESTLPLGLVASPTNVGAAETDSNPNPSAVVLASNNASDLTIDFGFHKPAPCVGAIGDFVWNDANNNGLQDAGELGIPNVTVTLRTASGNTIVAATTTDANGAYLFAGLCAGDYVVEVDPTTLPGGMQPSAANQGGNDEVDSDGIDNEALVSLPADTKNLTVDFGYFRKIAIRIVKLTNGTDNNAPTGPIVAVGSSVTWTYRVTSTGSTEPLRDVVVVDNNGTPGTTADDFTATYASGDTNGDNLLDVGETWVFTASGIAVEGQYGNVGTVTATGASSNTNVESQDPDHYFGFSAAPAIDIEKATNGEDADTPTGPTVNVGSTVTWTYVVTNTGNVPLTNVTVTDDKLAPAAINCGAGTNVIPSLGAGAAATCTATGIAVEGQYANLGTAVGTHNGTTVNDVDPSHYFGKKVVVVNPRTPGYWKNWNSCTGGNQVRVAAQNGGSANGYWLLDDVLGQGSITIGNLTLTANDCVRAVRVLDKSDVVTNRKRSTEPLFNLATHLFAATLNFGANATSCSGATSAATAAQTLLAKYGWNGTGSRASLTSSDSSLANSLANTLDSYNNGNLCQ